MNDLPRHDEIHVISDIHMGGEPGFQVLKETTRLASYVSWVGAQRPDQHVALVLNGDVIDTLAENIGGYVAIDNATSIVQRIMDDSSFQRVWDALAAFVRLPRRTLVIVLGNHDLEFAFPPVQRQVLSRLAGDNLEARARIEFSTIGAGYPCVVGNSRVFCTHGNEVDEWNFVRYEDLSRVARRLSAGRTLSAEEWRPNAGAKMVRDVMNTVKARYRWVDLLKPEMGAAVSVLAALDPSALKSLGQVATLLTQSQSEKNDRDQRLAAPGTVAPAVTSASPISIDQLLGPNLRGGAGAVAGGQDADAMLMAAERNRDKPRAAAAGPQDGTLGTFGYWWDRLRGMDKAEALRLAVKDWIKDDKSFQTDDQDATYRDVSANVSTDIGFIVTGHTHLERAIDMGSNRYYFNTGTWIRLMRFTEAMLADTASFKPIYDVLDNGSIDRLDGARIANDPIVLPFCTAVRIGSAAGSTTGALLHIEGNEIVTTTAIKSFTRS